MRPPPVRFPFVILPHAAQTDGAAKADAADAPGSAGKAVAAREAAEAVEVTADNLPAGMRELARSTEEKLDLILRKTVYLEAALDEYLEGADKPGPAGADDDPDRAAGGPEQLRSFFTALVSNLDALFSLADLIRQTAPERWREGIDIFVEKLLALLSSHGLVPSAEVGMPFDPERHEAVGSDSRSALQPGLVAEVVRQGWLYRDEVLRYAKVVVSKAG